MKIAQVVSTYPPYRGGMGKVAFEYTERLRALEHSVHVYTPKYREVKDDPDYVHRISSPIHVGNAGVVPSLFNRMKGFDIVHLHYPFFGGAEPVIIRKALRKDQALVMTYHMDAVADGFRGAFFNMHRRMLFPWLASRADKILVSSLDYAESSALANIENIFDCVEELPFGVELDRFFPGDEFGLKVELGIPIEEPVMIFVGGLDAAHHFKGLPVIFDALEHLRELKWHFVIVGSGELKESFKAQAQAKGFEDRIHFAGNVSSEDLPRYYRMADMHLFPSTARAEAFGLVALEAAASGIPTIASDLPGVRTVVLDGETGLRIAPNNVETLEKAIRLLLEEEDVRKRFGLSARKRAEQEYAWDPLMKKLEQIYIDLQSDIHAKL
jgi:glycosyltransferase involved in cell wall biosynthesis